MAPAARSAALLLAALALAACGLLPAVAGAEERLQLQYPASRNAADQPAGTVTKTELAGREIYYEVPQDPIGTVVFFHGCAHNAYDSWYPQEGCEECRGLPGEVSLTKQAISQGYAFVTINSLNRSSVANGKCFSQARDTESAAEALTALLKELDLQDLPVIVSGVSSGASFAIRLASEMPRGAVDGVLSIVLAAKETESVDWSIWPPVAFVRMEKDADTNSRIQRNQEALVAAGVPSQTIVSPEMLVYPTFFSDQAADINPELSAKIADALQQIGVIDAQGRLLDDPRKGFEGFDWREALREAVPELDGTSTTTSLDLDASAVYELLNTAYSNHEIVGSYLSAALRWFEAGGDADLEQLAEEWAIGKPALLTFDRLQPGEKPVSAGAAPEGADPVVAAPAPAA